MKIQFNVVRQKHALVPENEHSSPCIFKVTGRVTTGEPGNTPAPKEPEAASRFFSL